MKKLIALFAAIGVVLIGSPATAETGPIAPDCTIQGNCPPKPDNVVTDELDWILSCEGYQERTITGTVDHELVFLNNMWQWAETEPTYTVTEWVYSTFDESPQDKGEFDCTEEEETSVDEPEDDPTPIDDPIEEDPEIAFFGGGVHPTIN